MYHEIIDKEPSQYLLERVQRSFLIFRDNFREQMACLKEDGYSAVSPNDVLDALKKKKSIVKKPVLITFDDGFGGNYHHALPILEEHGLTATFFITSGLVGSTGMLTWDQIRKMNKAGMSIQSHTVTHPLLSMMSLDEMDFELRTSKTMIESEINSSVEFVSYPNGDFNSRVIERVKDAGYVGAFSSGFGLANSKTNEFAFSRIKIPGSYGNEDFKKIIDQDRKTYLFLKYKSTVFSFIKKIVGSNNYEKIYAKIFNLKSY